MDDSKMYFNVRFTPEVNELVRSSERGLPKRGSLSERVKDSLEGVDLERVTLVEVCRGGDKTPMTQIGLPAKLFRRSKEVATAREVSLNRLVNSAVVEHYRSSEQQ